MDKSSVIQILIAYSHGIFRDGLRKLLEAEPGFQVIGEVGTGNEAVKAARQLKPDVLLLDHSVPYQPALEALRALQSLSSPLHTILLVAKIEKEQLITSLQLGVRGLVLKESAAQLLIKGIRTVVSGQYWLGRESVSDVVGALRELQPIDGGAWRRKFGLTPRELDIVETVAAGYTNRDIAKKFSLSEQTVKHHLTSIFAKLAVSNRLELALYAVNHDLAARAHSDTQSASLEPLPKAPWSQERSRTLR